MQVWLTTADRAKALSSEPAIAFAADEPLSTHIDIDAERRYQQMVGFGAAITDASAWLIQTRMNAQQRAALLQGLFGSHPGTGRRPADVPRPRSGSGGDRPQSGRWGEGKDRRVPGSKLAARHTAAVLPGIGLSFTRLTIGASDFSRRHYSLDDVPAGATDPDLTHFSIDANRGDVLPVVRAALAVNPELKVMASPWSAPGWMKTTGSLIKGTLREEYFDAFARYLVEYVDAYAAEGVPIFALTVQNEPAFEPENYPGMRLGAQARARLIGKHLGPLLARRKSPTLIFDWDHNWDQPSEPLAILSDPVAARYVAGVAWHCYGGDVAAQSQVHEAFPDKDAYHTECSGGDWEPVRSGGLTLLTRQLIIDATRHWARGVLFWNLALDRDRGPHAGGCDTCRGVVTIDASDGTFERNDEYYALAHASRFVRPGAHRIGSSASRDGIDNVAFRNADDGSLVLIVANSADAARRFSVGHLGGTFRYELPAKSIATFTWPGDARKDTVAH